MYVLFESLSRDGLIVVVRVVKSFKFAGLV